MTENTTLEIFLVNYQKLSYSKSEENHKIFFILLFLNKLKIDTKWLE